MTRFELDRGPLTNTGLENSGDASLNYEHLIFMFVVGVEGLISLAHP